MNRAEKKNDPERQHARNRSSKRSRTIIHHEGYSSVTGLHYETGLPVRIDIENGNILEITPIHESEASEITYYVAPGLIDNQVNGYAGVDFSGDSLTEEGILKAARSSPSNRPDDFPSYPYHQQS